MLTLSARLSTWAFALIAASLCTSVQADSAGVRPEKGGWGPPGSWGPPGVWGPPGGDRASAQPSSVLSSTASSSSAKFSSAPPTSTAACTSTPASSLAQLALQQVLDAAAPVFGVYERNVTATNTSVWMKAYPDSTKLVHMNLPGTHDSSTWNYSQATQDSLLHITAVDGVVPAPANIYRCQDLSYFDMLNMGVRVFDIRYSFDATNSSLVLYHSAALQSETALLEDVMFGFYQWLADHPSEALLLSFMHESGTLLYDPIDAAVELAIYDVLTTPAAKQYILQTHDSLGTLGEARGKITLLRRFDLFNLSASYEASIPGLHFSPTQWVVNGPDFNITYNPAQNQTAYIEDFYNILAPNGSSAALNIQWKMNATTAALTRATLPSHADDLFWSFASSHYDSDVPVSYPRIMALGNGSDYTPLGGVNDRLVPFLQTLQGKRVGIVMFDFFEQPSALMSTFLGLLPPGAA